MLKLLLSWHKKLALFAVIPFMVWALSGLLHPMMLHFTKTERLSDRVSPIDYSKLENYQPIKAVLQRENIARLSHASLVEYQNTYYYQVAYLEQGQRKIAYFPLSKSKVAASLSDPQYAEYLAHKWALQGTISVEKLTEFDTAYGAINRILPVYRVLLDNGNRLYIDTLGQRISAHNTQLREQLSYWFRTLHTFSFIGDKHSYIRIIPMLIVTVTLFFMGLLGLIAYSVLWKKLSNKQGKVAKLHRVSGLVLSLCMLGFASSSSHILIDKFYPQKFLTLIPANSIQTAQINHDPISVLAQAQGDNFVLVSVGQGVYSQVVTSENRTQNYQYWQQNQAAISNTILAKSILQNQLNVRGELIHSQKVDKFGPTYGFINKRLPVMQLRYQSQPDVLYSIELSSGYIAAIENSWQKARSLHFGYLHKYHFLNPLSKEVRDIIITLIILGLVFSAVMGLCLYLARRKRQQQALQRRLSTI
ncbi:hypothetical protein PSECIP111951_02141 [Pseudoalteromonas holothuriae]|uniref:PepSY domain-containing protein n=1 Tax=Pseudoalteromonas holothuriae TaxID=2963714 RepID=A0A9W4QS72_9GAMM|nr:MULTISPECIES: PepSY domain-containing protein [unclassified Pseudoalteromonas]CAH9050778.1 hypothetical protein PSECIP111854_00601 [Pseudoalteromonas sp. CIP111854]CAH9059790.1 hypothetical protein PSECIP111951_02141 [Pseudoalteromonas sp. CIP111951]